MIKTLPPFPRHVFLLPAFFILHVLNSYYGLIPGNVYLTYSFYYCLLSGILLLTGRFITGSFSKGGMLTTGLLIIFYFFGACHDLLKSLAGMLASYTIVLPIILLLVIAWTVYLRKHTGTFRKGHRYLNILFTLFLLLEIAQLAYNILTGKQKENNYAHRSTPVLKNLGQQQDREDPDIFFIVFDEYTSSLALQKYLNYNNTHVDSTLLKNNFYVASKAQSNYNSTPLSITSCFNMSYIDKPLEGTKPTAKEGLQAWHSLKMSLLPKLLSENNYEIYNFALSDLNDHPVSTSRYFTRSEILPLYQETLWGRIERDIWWNVFKLNIPVLHKKREREYTSEANAYIDRNLKNLRLTIHELNKQTARKKFVFTHIMMPHAPFYVNETGQLQEQQVLTSVFDRSLYLKQLAYCNRWIDSLAKAANQSFSRPRVVIIEGDHGFRDANTLTGIREKQFMNLNAYYFSDKDYRLLYDSISPVNSFKVVLNKYFQAAIPLSKDSTILLQ